MYKIKQRLARFPSSGRIQEYRGYITQYNYVQVNRRYDCAITDLILETRGGPRMLAVSLPVGVTLYNYINSGGHLSRLDGIHFECGVLVDEQKITSFRAFDEKDFFSPVGVET